MSVVTYAVARAQMAELLVEDREEFARQVAASYYAPLEIKAITNGDVAGLLAMTSMVAALISGSAAEVTWSADGDMLGFAFFPELEPYPERREAQS